MYNTFHFYAAAQQRVQEAEHLALHTTHGKEQSRLIQALHEVFELNAQTVGRIVDSKPETLLQTAYERIAR